MESTKTRSPWAWVPSLYFAEGIPYVMVMTVSVVLYKNLGISNTLIALYTSWLYLPWVIKPLWSPLVDLFQRKRVWIVTTQFLIATGFAAIAMLLPGSAFFKTTLAVFWLIAFCSATHDIAADGFYMLGLSERQQAAYVGVRSTFYRIAMIAGQGGLVVLAGELEKRNFTIANSWAATFLVLSGVFLILAIYHTFRLPVPEQDQSAARTGENPVRNFLRVFALFFRKKGIGPILAFLLLYRFAEAQLVKMAAPFLLDTRAAGGLGLSTSQVGFTYGTVGMLALIASGLLGGLAIARKGLKFWLWFMVFALHIPDFLFVYLSHFQPQNFAWINVCVALEQFGYGFGFTAYSLFMIMVSRGEHKTAHFAICTGFMALGMMLPGMASGWIQEHLGYRLFFWYVILATIPSFLVPLLVKIDPEFGTKGA